MKTTLYNKSKLAILLALLAAASFSGCTKKFEEYNTNPYGVSDQDLKADYKIVGEGFKQVQLNIYSYQPAWLTQLQQNLIADVYSGYMMPPTPFRNNSNNMNYDLVDGWNGFPWSTAYNSVMAPVLDIQKKAATDFKDFYAWSQILKVEAMHRVSDIYGPIIYTQYGKVNSDGSITYDSQKDAYYAFFKDLSEAIATLTPLVNSTANPFQKFDLVYGGDYKKWVKFANTLRLRLALRIAKIDPTKAKAEGEAALANSVGLMTDPDDIFKVDIGTTTHPLNVMNNSWADIRMGAPMESVMVGYNDPRLPFYFKKSDVVAGEYKGIRNGIDIAAKADYQGFSPLADFESKILLMTVAEAWFLKAEAAIRGWAGAGSAQTNYENGINASMSQYGVSGASYLVDAASKPKAYVDPKNATNNVPDGNPNLSTATIKWDDAAGFETKLEKIITQKWIAMYPDGQEAWSEFRRTGYPKLFPVVINNSGGKIPTATFIRRINFPTSEYSTNPKGVADAVTKLGGPDTGGTRLWWDKP